MTPNDSTHSPGPIVGAASDAASSNELASCLSALADGQANAADSACARWRDDAAARRTWHAYHLIGDVMRSEELATKPSSDAVFLASLRARLAAEPVPLSPAPMSTFLPQHARASTRKSWFLPAAAAAGFVAVAGVLVLTRSAAPDAGSAVEPLRLATQVPAAERRASAVLASTQVPSAAAAVAEATRSPSLIRDARLDEYLRAHQAAGGLAVATPGGWLRRVDAVVAQPPAR